MSNKLTEAGHKIAEKAEAAWDKAKEVTGQSNQVADLAKEKQHQVENRAQEMVQKGENLVGTGNTQGEIGKMTGVGVGEKYQTGEKCQTKG